MGQQHAVVQALRFDEHFGEGGMSRIGAMRRQGQFQVAGELELPASQRTIGDGQPPQFHIVFGGDGHVQDGFDAEDTPRETRRDPRRSVPMLVA